MASIISQINLISSDYMKALESCSSLEALEAIRVTFLGRKGKVADLMPLLASLSIEEKREVGPLINDLKKILNSCLNKKNRF